MKKLFGLLVGAVLSLGVLFCGFGGSVSATESVLATEGGSAAATASENTVSVDRTFEFTKEELEDKAFLFFGDSLTARYGLSAGDLDYIQILRSEFGFYSYNGAVSGATWTVDGKSGAEHNTNHLFSQLEKAKILIRDADYISIMLGTNDYGWGVRPLGSISDNPTAKEEATTVYGAIRYALDYIIAANSDVKIMLMTPPLWLSNGFDKENSVGVTLGEVREAVKAVGAEYGCKVVDMSAALPSEERYFNSDKLHISPLGYEKLSEYIKNYGKN
ncbi:MAG: SGNH/GDSL hydrolase family protein [Clostridia bacterium]|nr:SGNH/GDSL hydrolase family protein [Clostridia bacterium]